MPKKPLKVVESPVTFLSEGQQIVGMLHQGGRKELVLLCHGFTGHKVESRRIFVELGRCIAQDGADALRFDFYGSGDSAGAFADTRISHNIANLRDALEWARQRGYEKVAVLGLSMGAATAILTLAETLADALITWSAVPDMRKVFEAHINTVYRVPEHNGLYEHEGWLIKKEFWEEALHYDVAAAFARLAMPKFILQGSADDPVFVDGFHHFRDLAVPPADFMEIPGASHTFIAPAHRHQAIRQTLIWLKRNFYHKE